MVALRNGRTGRLALVRTSTLVKEEYVYDNAGRLTQVQEAPQGEGCKTRIYTYDEDSNRTSLTIREPGAEGRCATTGGSTETHTYDEADCLNDINVSYELSATRVAISRSGCQGQNALCRNEQGEMQRK